MGDVGCVGATALTIVISGLAVLDAERGHGGNIQNVGDAIWWAFVTITTVGYGDFYPVTAAGRVAAVGLMIGGITLIGVVTATLASWIVERVSLESENAGTAAPVATADQMEALRAEVAELRGLLGARERSGGGDPDAPHSSG